MQQQVRGIDWVNIITGTDFNSGEGKTRAPRHFAEIHLLIPLTEQEKTQLEGMLAAKDMKKMKQLLKDALKGGAVHDANKRLIDAIELRQ